MRYAIARGKRFFVRGVERKEVEASSFRKPNTLFSAMDPGEATIPVFHIIRVILF